MTNPPLHDTRDRLSAVIDWTVFGLGVLALSVAIGGTLLTGTDTAIDGAAPDVETSFSTG